MFTPLHLFLHQCYQDNTIIMVSIIIWNKGQMINIVIDVILNQPFLSQGSLFRIINTTLLF